MKGDFSRCGHIVPWAGWRIALACSIRFARSSIRRAAPHKLNFTYSRFVLTAISESFFACRDSANHAGRACS